MRSRIIIVICVYMALANHAWADDSITWTLNDCIEYAKQQNITIQKSKLSLQSSEVDLALAKAAYWPSLSFSTSQSLRYMPFGNDKQEGLASDGTTKQSQNELVASGNYGLNFNWVIWNGSRQKSIDQQKIEAEISEKQVAKSENDITESIMLIFMRVQYAEESVRLNEATLQLSEQQMKRGEAMQKVGSLSASEYAQLVSQWSSNRYTLITSQSTLASYRLQLCQLLELPASTAMKLSSPEISTEEIMQVLPSAEEVYATSLSLRPEIQASQLSVESSSLAIDKAKSGYMPSFGLTAGSSISHSSAGTVSVADQIKNGWNNQVGINMSVPIVDKRQTKSAVEKAKLQHETELLNLEQQQKDLRKTIETLWLDATSSQMQYEAAVSKMEAAQTSYDLVSEQFKVGVKHATDLLQAQETLLSAQQELLQTKYMARYSINMLRFYQGIL